MKIELGGGVNPRGDGYQNIDLLDVPGVDCLGDFERLGRNGVTLPFADDSVDEVYSAHALEHVKNVHGVLREIARVCRIGAHVEIRVPHWLSDVSMCPGHRAVLSEHWFRDICHVFIAEWWRGCHKRLRLTAAYSIPWAEQLDAARPAFPRLNDDQLMRFIPGCVHEVRYHFEVIANV